MPPFSRQLLIACLTAMCALLFFIAVLVVILIVAQQLRGEAEAAPGQLTVFAGAMAALGWVSGRCSAYLSRQ